MLQRGRGPQTPVRPTTMIIDNVNRRRNLGFFFDQSVARLPDKVAIIDLFGGKERRATYRQLDARMNRVASVLARLGVAPGERVAMGIGNRTEFIEFFFGSMRAGAIPLPLNIRLAAPTLEQIVADAACTLAVVDPSSHRDALAIARRSPLRLILDQRAEGFLSFEDEMAKPAAPVDAPEIADDAQAFQPYTSGSTGRPKGAIMTHHGMLWYVAYNQRYWPSTESGRGLGQVQMHLFAGRGGGVHDVSRASRLSAHARPQRVARAHDRVCSGDARTHGRGRTRASHVKVSESYGLTEGGSPLRPPIDGRAVPRGSPGVAAPEIELRLIDADGDDAEEGELLIRCPYVCRGYYNEPDITRAKLTDGWLHTGDIFCKEKDGFFYFRSRVDDMFSCGGENIY